MADFSAAQIEKLLEDLNERRSKDGERKLELEADGVHVRLENGALATWEPATSKLGKKYARWTIKQGAPDEYLARVRTPKGQHQQGKPLSKEDAEKAFNRYYARRDYASDRARKAAITRDVNYSPAHDGKVDQLRVWESTRYLRNPGSNDYPGVDAGEKLSKATGNTRALEEWRRDHPKGSESLKGKSRRSHQNILRNVRHASEEEKRRAKEYRESRKVSKKGKGKREDEREEELLPNPGKEGGNGQQGGRAVSLKTAVRLLRNYYSNRYQQ